MLLINPRLKWFEKLGLFGEDVKTTLSAQIATLPILLAIFCNVKILEILVNVLILWTIPILMVLVFVGVLVGLVFAPLGKFIHFFSLPLLLFFEKVVKFFGGLQWNVVVDSFPWQLGVGYYLFVIALLLFHRHKSHPKGELSLQKLG